MSEKGTVTAEHLRQYSRLLVSLLPRRGLDDDTAALFLTVIAAAPGLTRQLKIAQELSRRLRSGLADARFAAVEERLLARCDLTPRFFLSHQSDEVTRILNSTRIATAFEEQVLEQCVGKRLLSGDYLARAQRHLAKRSRFKNDRAGWAAGRTQGSGSRD